MMEDLPMPNLLLEIYSEEIPAGMQLQAAQDLKRILTKNLNDAGFNFAYAQEYSTPHRLALNIVGLDNISPTTSTVQKGPHIHAPQKNLDGFAKSVGLSDINDAKVIKYPNGKKYYTYNTKTKERSLSEYVAKLLPKIIKSFPWPKSQRWGVGNLKWVRPIHSILCILYTNVNAAEVINFEINGIQSGDTTKGHRFMAPDTFSVTSFDDYFEKLNESKVMLNPNDRKKLIQTQAELLANSHNAILVKDQELVDEIAGLVEWPVILAGHFDKLYLQLPNQVIQLTLRTNQKYLTAVNKKNQLQNLFIFASNILTPDNGAQIIKGNEKVVRARLSDAKFFYDSDLNIPLSDFTLKLNEITFHEKLGSVAERIKRIDAITKKLCSVTGANYQETSRAAKLIKADLCTNMVKEFPSLQGKVGRIYAEAGKENWEIALAIEEHYKPKGPSDSTPSNPISVTLAIAEKLDTLIEFWSIDEKPTGSKDPFALRRAALGIIRLIIDNKLHLALSDYGTTSELREFIQDRFLGWIKNQHHSLKVFDILQTQNHPINNLYISYVKIRAMSDLQNTKSGAIFLKSLERSKNVLQTAREKKINFQQKVKPHLFQTKLETEVHAALIATQENSGNFIKVKDYSTKLANLASLFEPINSFLDDVIVISDNRSLTSNRLALLDQLLNNSTRIISSPISQ